MIIQKIPELALKHRRFTLVIVLAIMAVGLTCWLTMRKEAYPDVGDTQVTVITTYSGRAAKEVEQQVTIPLERELNSLPHVISRRSKTIFGLSVIQLTFDDAVDDYFARQRVIERLGGADLPKGVKPELGPLTGPVGEVFRYVVVGDARHSPMALRTLQDWVIIPKLLQVAGVADVINFGGLVKQYHIVTSPEKLVQYGLTIGDIETALAGNNINTGGNMISRGEQGLMIRAVGTIQTKQDIENTVLISKNGVPISIKNIGSIEEGPEPPAGILSYAIRNQDGVMETSNAGIQGLVVMLRGENPAKVVEGLQAKVAEINATALPEGVQLKVTTNRSELVQFTLETVMHTLLVGMVVVIMVLFFFIGNMRAALVVVAAIPVSLLFAFTLMKIVGIPANLLSLGAIDFGIIVDGAVVIVENLMRGYRHASIEEKTHGIIPFTLHATQEVAKEIFFSISIIVCAYLPIFTFQRVEGKLFSPMAYTLAFAIGGSMLISLTAIPVLMTFLYRNYFDDKTDSKPLQWENPVYNRFEQFYSRQLDGLLQSPKRIILAASAIVVGVLMVGIHAIGTEFLPDLDEGAINVRCFMPVGISLATAQRHSQHCRDILSQYPEVAVVLCQLGRNDDGTDPYGPNRLEMFVKLKPYSEWHRPINRAQLLSMIKSNLESQVPGAHFSFSQPILDNVTESVTGSVADLAILINGHDLALMRQKANAILGIVQTIRGATEYGIEQEGDQDQLVVTVDREKAARYGIKVSDIQDFIETAVGGFPIGTLYDDAQRFDIVIRYQSPYRSSLSAIQNLLIGLPSGIRIPLKELAHIDIKAGPSIIQRQNGYRQISVRTNIRGRDQGSFVKEAQAKVNAQITLPDGYFLSWGGVFENLTRAVKQLAIVVPITLILICVLLGILYQNWRHLVVVLSCIPLTMIGGLLALLLRGYNLNVSAGVGFISLFGLSTMSGVLFVSRANHYLKQYPDLSIQAVVKKATVVQLRPLIMTILLALLGLIPAALATGIGSDVQRPLATVVVGGMLSGLLLIMMVLPPLYMVLQKDRITDDEE